MSRFHFSSLQCIKRLKKTIFATKLVRYENQKHHKHFIHYFLYLNSISKKNRHGPRNHFVIHNTPNFLNKNDSLSIDLFSFQKLILLTAQLNMIWLSISIKVLILIKVKWEKKYHRQQERALHENRWEKWIK